MAARKKRAAAPEAPVTVQDKALAMLRAKDIGKDGYSRADALFKELLAEVGVGGSIDLGNGETLTIIDPFAGKDKVWKPAGVSRYDYKVSRTPAAVSNVIK